MSSSSDPHSGSSKSSSPNDGTTVVGGTGDGDGDGDGGGGGGNPTQNGLRHHAPSAAVAAAANKRTRVLLSCAPCRSSKLKCDRATPCGQCAKKGRPEACAYAPRPQKQRPAKSMAARLKRLEGMVREMIDTDDPGTAAAAAAAADVAGAPPPAPAPEVEAKAGGLVVQGQKATSYVGATHFMAILDDIEDLKNYFEDSEDEDEGFQDPFENVGPSEVLFSSRGVMKDKEELLRLLPDKNVVDRLMNRYFHSNSPSQHILHRPTFSKEYHRFWQNPSEAPLQFVALLFMVTGLGVFFSSFQSPHELESDSPMPAMDRFRQYRGAAGWALIWGKYSQPNLTTIQAFLLYVEAEFLVNRTHQMNCYLLSSVCIRLMLKMGLHRDPSKLPNISIYEGEMRRRLWHLAIQIDLLVAFYLGLPSMIQGIESDTATPRHLMDSDFDEDSTDLPPSRPMADYTQLTYPIHKGAISRVFGLVAQQAHALTVPPYSEVTRVDRLLEETWKQVPLFMKVKPLEESITDPVMQVIQRYGLAALYLKSRCVLHRRYLSEAVPKQEHGYSRRACLEAALDLLDHQYTLYHACQPGAILSTKGWFISSLAINDFLQADMIVALVLQNENYLETGGNFDWVSQGAPLPSKNELLRILQRSYNIWTTMAQNISDCKKAADVVERILGRVYTQLGLHADGEYQGGATGHQLRSGDQAESMANLNLHGSSGGMTDPSLGSSGVGSAGADAQEYRISPDFDMVDDPNIGRVLESMQVEMSSADPSWMIHSGSYDWNQFDALTRAPADATAIPQADQEGWLNNETTADDFQFLISNGWTPVHQP